MTKLQVEFDKHVKRVTRAILKKYPEAVQVTSELSYDYVGKQVIKVVVWNKDQDILVSNFGMRGTTKQVIQQINAGALTE